MRLLTSDKYVLTSILHRFQVITDYWWNLRKKIQPLCCRTPMQHRTFLRSSGSYIRRAV